MNTVVYMVEKCGDIYTVPKMFGEMNTEVKKLALINTVEK